MTDLNAEWRAKRQRRWMRENAHRYFRPDAWRYMAPGAPRYYGKDVFKYFEDGTRPNRANFSDHVLERKFDPDQPRAPAGTPEGGQWTSGGGGSSKGPADPNKIKQDVRSEQPWEVFKTLHWPDGSVAQQTIFSRDGTAIRAEFAQPGATGTWDERYAVLTADGTLTSFQNLGLEQTIVGADGRILSQTIWTNNGPEPQAIVQPAFLAPAVEGGAAAIRAGIALFTWLSAKSPPGGEREAVIGFRARLFAPNKIDDTKLDFVGELSRDEVRAACPRLDEVQRRTDDAAQQVNALTRILSPTQYGTAVHKNLKDQIDLLKDPDFRAEVSFLKSKEAGYGTKGSMRIDLLENAGRRTICYHDIKTGETELGLPRSTEIVFTTWRAFPNAERLIVIQTKPNVERVPKSGAASGTGTSDP